MLDEALVVATLVVAVVYWSGLGDVRVEGIVVERAEPGCLLIDAEPDDYLISGGRDQPSLAPGEPRSHPEIAALGCGQLWKQRTPDLLDSAASEVMHRLREALFLEGLDMIARVSDESSTEVVVTDRARLADLRRRWDEKLFGFDHVEH